MARLLAYSQRKRAIYHSQLSPWNLHVTIMQEQKEILQSIIETFS